MFSTDRYRNHTKKERDQLLAEENYDLANDLDQSKQKPEVDKGQEFVDNMRKGRKVLRFIKENNFQKGGDWIFPKNELLEKIIDSSNNPQILQEFIAQKIQNGEYSVEDLNKIKNISTVEANNMLLLKKMVETFRQVSSPNTQKAILVYSIDGGVYNANKEDFASNPRMISEQILKPLLLQAKASNISGLMELL